MISQRAMGQHMIPEHLDPMYPLNVPDNIRARLRKNGNAHKYRAKRINKEAGREVLNEIEDFDVTEIYDQQEWTCNICFKRVDIYAKSNDPMAPVCGHMNNLKNGGGHIKSNIHIQHKKCNDWIANAIEKRREKKVRSLRRSHRGINSKGGEYIPKPKKAIPSRSETLSGQSQWPKRKTNWPKRKFGE